MDEVVERLAGIPGVVAVVLGGSRARGEHRPDSDTDLGIYYRGRLDIDQLRELAAEVASKHEVFGLGDWGPWVAFVQTTGTLIEPSGAFTVYLALTAREKTGKSIF